MADLRSYASLRNKYTLKEYEDIYPQLFSSERKRLSVVLEGLFLEIVHIGSTAIPRMPGKGIIDIYISVSDKLVSSVKQRLIEQGGYEYRVTGGDDRRLFFQKEIDGRRYHVHVTDPKNPDLQNAILFRDHLRANPSDARTYAEIKVKASEAALKFRTRNSMKNAYNNIKDSLIKEIMKKIKDQSRSH